MAKTESTAVTRLIELAQQRPVEANLDWFGAPMGKPKKRLERTRTARREEEVTQVVRVPGRPLQASPATVIGAFFAGVLTVAVTMLVLRTTEPAPAPVVAPATVPVVSAPQETAVVAPAPQPTATVIAAIPDPGTDPGAGTGTAPDEATVKAVRAPERTVDRTVERPTRPTRARAPAEIARPRAGRSVAKEGGGPLAELRINSKPPCQLFVDGRDMGWTPQRGIAVAPGRHTVVFRNREFGVERKVIVDAKVGEVHRVIRDFTEP